MQQNIMFTGFAMPVFHVSGLFHFQDIHIFKFLKKEKKNSMKLKGIET
jgi:hypothetical protein